jgi:predicted protein tyrosine phosphatase
MKKIDIYVFSMKTIQEFITDRPHIIISIREPSTPRYDNQWPEVPISLNLIGRLNLDFSDMDCRKSSPEHLKEVGYKLFTVEDAKSILKFLELTLPYINLIAVNCPGGISRSSAVAAAIAKILEQDDQIYFAPKGPYNPNRFIYRTILNTYMDSRPIGEKNA